MNSPSTFWSVGSSTAQGAIATTTYTENYTYNAIGNLTNKSDVGAYVYAGTNYTNPYAPTSVNGSTITYDNNGNLTSDGIWTNTWDYRNRLTQSSKGTATSTYAYDQQDNRVKLTEGSVTTLFPNKLYSVMLGGSATTTKHIFASDLLLSTITSGATASSTAATTSVIYSDSLDANWSDWSFGTTNTLNSTGTVFSGTSAIKTVYMGAWDGLYLHHAGLSTNTSTHLHFSFYATSSSPFLPFLRRRVRSRCRRTPR